MHARRTCLYFSWSRPLETSAPLADIDNRFPALFESRRMLYPRYDDLARRDDVDQGIAGFLDHIQKPNFTAFARFAEHATRCPTPLHERIDDQGTLRAIDDELLADVDTLIVISFDSLRSAQAPTDREVDAIRRFLEHPDHLLVVCPHHDIGDVDALPASAQRTRQDIEHHHHGDITLPPQQRFGGFARALLADLGIPVENRFGLRPRLTPDGTPWPFHAERSLDRWGLLAHVDTFNAHPHLPHFEPLGPSMDAFDVLVRQDIDPSSPPHPFCENGRRDFDALLQSRPGVFNGTVLVGDATLWSSTAGGVDQLQTFWSNVLHRAGTTQP